MAPIYDIGPYMGEILMLKAFIVVIIGGLGSIPGAAIGGLLLGLLESGFATFYSQNIAMILSYSSNKTRNWLCVWQIMAM